MAVGPAGDRSASKHAGGRRAAIGEFLEIFRPVPEVWLGEGAV